MRPRTKGMQQAASSCTTAGCRRSRAQSLAVHLGTSYINWLPLPAGTMSALSQKESDIQLMLAASCHLGTRNCDYQMERYVYKRRLDGIYVINLGKTWEKLHLAARVIVGIENPQVSSLQPGLVDCRILAMGHWAWGMGQGGLPSVGIQDPHGVQQHGQALWPVCTQPIRCQSVVTNACAALAQDWSRPVVGCRTLWCSLPAPTARGPSSSLRSTPAPRPWQAATPPVGFPCRHCLPGGGSSVHAAVPARTLLEVS